jgi:hypothetical protein
MQANGGGKVVGHSSHQPKVEGSSTAAAGGTRRKTMPVKTYVIRDTSLQLAVVAVYSIGRER